MAVYKVPQDVEADDKLIGPFSFRQFIYIIIAVISIALAWGLAQLFIPLAIIPLPLILFFGALALPLRKDQPMEIYLAAVVSFYLKPRKRLWQPDGIQSLVEVTAPKVVEIQRSKNLSQDEAQQRLSYLADIVDTRGWAVRGVVTPEPTSAMQNDAYYEAQQAPDVLDEKGGIAQSFDTMINQADAKRHNEMVERMHNQPAVPQPQTIATPIPDPYTALAPTSPVDNNQATDPHLTYNPYPNSIHQSVINPLGQAYLPQAPAPEPQVVVPLPKAAAPEPQVPQNPPPATSNAPVSPDIINLANNSDLSIETIAHEANRIHEREKLPDDEVVISLR
ncbi:MAG TPA: PrgI family protein [Candidatus Saccharimonadales bacterium]|nr:PrgI family protein [Candidatus Saccharimonadales bacterium]